VLLVLAGATGTGKTGLSIEVAEAIAAAGGAAEVVNADAMQLYRGMDVGTAKASPAERRGIPHHLLDLWDVTETASVAVYRDAARTAIADVEARGAVPILVGGSGLYVESVVRELEFPATDPDLRADLEQQAEVLGADALWRRLAEEDPVAAGRIHSANLRKVVRALEVVTLTGRPFAASLPDAAPLWRPAVRFVVDVPKEPLAERLTPGSPATRARWRSTVSRRTGRPGCSRPCAAQPPERSPLSWARVAGRLAEEAVSSGWVGLSKDPACAPTADSSGSRPPPSPSSPR
jgi:tRNA dimethylallyltransferase